MAKSFKITAKARGKELLLSLASTAAEEEKPAKPAKSLERKSSKAAAAAMDTSDEQKEPAQSVSILFRFGMSGSFELTGSWLAALHAPGAHPATLAEPSGIHKHAHLRFSANNGKILRYVDFHRSTRHVHVGLVRQLRGRASLRPLVRGRL